MTECENVVGLEIGVAKPHGAPLSPELGAQILLPSDCPAAPEPHVRRITVRRTLTALAGKDNNELYSSRPGRWARFAASCSVDRQMLRSSEKVSISLMS